MDLEQYNDIAPFSDEEAAAAIQRLANHPNVPWISKFIFRNQPETYLRDILRNIHTVDEFQKVVMSYAIEWVIKTSVHNFSYDGLSKLQAIKGKYLAMSNHRDIILDPAFLQIILHWNNMPMTQICVGDNLLKQKSVELLIRSNRMIKVIRGISARELYLSSQHLSEYIRESITSGTSSVWIAQRQGRTKDGNDITEQGLLKMFDMSGTKDFVQNFLELNIVPLSISYEYEPCDILKAREVLISRTQKYVKTENEDLQSIMLGIKQPKGNVHMNFGDPLTEEEIVEASFCDKNDRYQKIRHAVDRRIIKGYKLWKTNYIAYDLMNGTSDFAEQYTPEEVKAFKDYMAGQLQMVEPELDKAALADIFLHIYGNPVASFLSLSKEEED
ncbi:MAG: 1-acyl-sn-glycerol-3-phosphate acyltransferase [Bacteroidales bacterium]|nr:1-acyl-sn-glycerol-3-phosphate acyltransferase [Bacteroidales bacterium]